MGVVCVVITLSDENIALLHQDPPMIWRLLEPEDETLYLDALGVGRKPGLLARLLGRTEPQPPQQLPEFQLQEDEGRQVDLDKSWDGLRFCLNALYGNQAAVIFTDGMEVGKVEVGYGPAQTFTGGTISQLHNLLCDIDTEAVTSCLDSRKMKSVYPKGLWSGDQEAVRDYLQAHFLSLKECVGLAASRGFGLCVCYL